MRAIKTVGVVGAGATGAAIAQKFAEEKFSVVFADRQKGYVNKALRTIKDRLIDGMEQLVFTGSDVDVYLSRIQGTSNMQDLKKCDLVIEAIFDDFDAKSELFRQLDDIVSSDTILATNSSSFSINQLAASVSNPERFVGLHYMNHTEKNRLVEIVPGDKTSSDVIETVKAFSMFCGKDPIVCHDSSGFVVDRFFASWLNEAARLLDENVANVATIDDVCVEVFGAASGPFALMSEVGIFEVCNVVRKLERFGRFYEMSRQLARHSNSGKEWDLQGFIYKDEDVRLTIADRMLGAVFFVSAQLLDEGVCSATDVDRGAKIGLKWKNGPVELMQYHKKNTVSYLVRQVARSHGMPLPMSIGPEYWSMRFVDLEKRGNLAILTINRPEALNALNLDVLQQMDEKFADAELDPTVDTIFITGAGTAFVAGPDVNFFVENIEARNIGYIESFMAYGQEVFRKIDSSAKKVVAVINGLALGGGLELALCADIVVALPRAQMAFPETGLGIYPALGSTQRCAAKIGKALTKYLILTGKMISAGQAQEIGLVDHVISLDEMLEMFSGEYILPAQLQAKMPVKWRQVAQFFEQNTTGKIMNGSFVAGTLSPVDGKIICNSLKRKAPTAVHLADKLIEEGLGCDSGLKYLDLILSSSDALLGLTSLGLRVEFTGE